LDHAELLEGDSHRCHSRGDGNNRLPNVLPIRRPEASTLFRRPDGGVRQGRKLIHGHGFGIQVATQLVVIGKSVADPWESIRGRPLSTPMACHVIGREATATLARSCRSCGLLRVVSVFPNPDLTGRVSHDSRDGGRFTVGDPLIRGHECRKIRVSSCPRLR
jgi:hypothetical protein